MYTGFQIFRIVSSSIMDLAAPLFRMRMIIRHLLISVLNLNAWIVQGEEEILKDLLIGNSIGYYEYAPNN